MGGMHQLGAAAAAVASGKPRNSDKIHPRAPWKGRVSRSVLQLAEREAAIPDERERIQDEGKKKARERGEGKITWTAGLRERRREK